VQGKWNYLGLMIGGMIMEDLDVQGVLAGTNIIIPQGTQPE
jgi:hypothetical protein